MLLATTLAATTSGCAVDAADQDVAARKDGLGFLAQPVEHRLIRAKIPGCAVVPGTGGTWSGAPIFATALGANPDFCAYTWSSPTNAAPDEARLKGAAVPDRAWGKQYMVDDVRPFNRGAQATTLTRRTRPLAAPRTGFAAASNGVARVASSAGSSAGPGGLVGDIDIDPVPEGASNCEVCGGGDFPGDAFIWFVLPPEAIGGGILSIDTNVGTYDIGPVTEQVFYAPAPAGLSGHVTVHWGP